MFNFMWNLNRQQMRNKSNSNIIFHFSQIYIYIQCKSISGRLIQKQNKNKSGQFSLILSHHPSESITESAVFR